jgi:hypothetical protein
MKLSKKIAFFASLLGIALLMSGCSLFDSDTFNSATSNMNEMDLFNKYVEEINKDGASISAMHNTYESSVPLEVKAEDEITLSLDTKKAADNQLDSSKAALLESNLTIDATEKQDALENLYNDYYQKYKTYSTTYDNVAVYYNNSQYKTDAAAAVGHEQTIQTQYRDIKTAQEALFDKLDEYQKSSAFKADINSTDPIERINAAIDLLTNDVEDLYSAYMEDWDVKSEPTAVKEKFETLKQQEKQTIDSVNALEYIDPQVATIKDYFTNNYIVSLDAHIAYYQQLLNDYDAGLVSVDNIDTYDVNIQGTYDQVISDHNALISKSEEVLSTEGL